MSGEGERVPLTAGDVRKVRVEAFREIDKGLLIPIYLYTCPHWHVFTTAREQYCSQCDKEAAKPMVGWTPMRSRLVGVVSVTLDPKTQELRAQVLEAGRGENHEVS